MDIEINEKYFCLLTSIKLYLTGRNNTYNIRYCRFLHFTQVVNLEILWFCIKLHKYKTLSVKL